MTNKTSEHIVKIVMEEQHPLKNIMLHTRRRHLSSFRSFSGNRIHDLNDFKREVEEEIAEQGRAIEKITQFLIDHEELCFKCALRNEKEAQNILEEEHPLDIVIADINNFESTRLDTKGSVSSRLIFWVRSIAKYVRKRM